MAASGIRTKLTFLALLLGSGAGAQIVPLGPEFQVNGYTGGPQISPAVAAGAAGGFVAVWSGRDPQLADYHLLSRRFGTDGLPVGDEIRVNEVARPQATPGSVAVESDGGFVVVWSPGGEGVMGRRFEADDTPRGPEFAVEPQPDQFSDGASVGAAADGGFVVNWSDYVDASGRLYDAQGEPLGEVFSLTGSQAAILLAGRVRVLPTGEFLGSWTAIEAVSPPPFLWRTSGRRFAADGEPLGPAFLIAESEGYSGPPELDADAAGNLVAVWRRTDPLALWAQRFAPDGSPDGPAVPVETHFGGFDACLLVEADGSFTVAWTSSDSPGDDGSQESIQVRHFPLPPAAVAPQFQLNTYTEDRQRGVACARLANGDLVVAWQSAGSNGDDDSNESIQARLLRLAFFADGFETGDASRWSIPLG